MPLVRGALPRSCVACVAWAMVAAIAGCKGRGTADSGRGAPGASSAPAASFAPAASSAPPVSSAGAPGPVVREARSVRRGDVSETLLLAWATPARPLGPEGSDLVFPVGGRGGDFGERGELWVVRERPGAVPERLPLGVFELARWPRLPGDGETMPLADLATRTPVAVMQLGDYDHDGVAAELPLLVTIHAPGTFVEDRREILVGVDRKTGRLAVIGDARFPDKPLTTTSWAPLLEKNPAEIVESPCGDHGRGYEKTHLVRAAPDGLHVKVRTYDCVVSASQPARRGRRLSEVDWKPDDHGVHGTYPNHFVPEAPEP